MDTGIKIVPSGRQDWCSACDAEHGYDCPKDKCICDLFKSPSYHVSDDPHSVEKKWDCPVHGHQERYWLIHKEKEMYCVPCMGTKIGWVEAKKNLLALYERYPNMVGDLLDSAYLHGLETKNEH